MNENNNSYSNTVIRERVLVVDDDAGIRKSLLRIMHAEAISARAYESAEALMESELPDDPSCLLLDLQLPGIDGLELQCWLARECPAMEILFMSSHADVRGVIAALKNGAVDFLLKPFESSVLLASVQAALQKARGSLKETALRSDIWVRYESLTPREKEVFEFLVTGQLNKQVAHQLGIAEKTIKVHRARIKKKLRINTAVDLIRCADMLGIGPGTPAVS